MREIQYRRFEVAAVFAEHVSRAHARRDSQSLRETVHRDHAHSTHVTQQRAEQLTDRSLAQDRHSFAEQVRQLAARMDHRAERLRENESFSRTCRKWNRKAVVRKKVFGHPLKIMKRQSEYAVTHFESFRLTVGHSAE